MNSSFKINRSPLQLVHRLLRPCFFSLHPVLRSLKVMSVWCVWLGAFTPTVSPCPGPRTAAAWRVTRRRRVRLGVRPTARSPRPAFWSSASSAGAPGEPTRAVWVTRRFPHRWAKAPAWTSACREISQCWNTNKHAFQIFTCSFEACFRSVSSWKAHNNKVILESTASLYQ